MESIYILILTTLLYICPSCSLVQPEGGLQKGPVNSSVTVIKNNSNESHVVINKPKKVSAGFETTSNNQDQFPSGAVERGLWVFVAVSLLFFVYLAIKTYRKRNRVVVVRKYGVRAKRTDLEMEPLPLDDDEDDETVFDVSNINNR